MKTHELFHVGTDDRVWEVRPLPAPGQEEYSADVSLYLVVTDRKVVIVDITDTLPTWEEEADSDVGDSSHLSALCKGA